MYFSVIILVYLISIVNASENNCYAPKYIFVFSTGHVGTTTLAQRSNYASGSCNINQFVFLHEIISREFSRYKLESTAVDFRFDSFKEWYHHRNTTQDDITDFVKVRIVPFLRSQSIAKRSAKVKKLAIMGHDMIFYYRELIQLLPQKEFLFIRVRRNIHEVVRSFKDKKYQQHSYVLMGWARHNINYISRSEWKLMSDERRIVWFDNEVETRWQWLKTYISASNTLEINAWSKPNDTAPTNNFITFKELVEKLANAIGLSVRKNNILPNKKRHTANSRRV